MLLTHSRDAGLCLYVIFQPCYSQCTRYHLYHISCDIPCLCNLYMYVQTYVHILNHILSILRRWELRLREAEETCPGTCWLVTGAPWSWTQGSGNLSPGFFMGPSCHTHNGPSAQLLLRGWDLTALSAAWCIVFLYIWMCLTNDALLKTGLLLNNPKIALPLHGANIK